jgi:hypothetical protein
MRQRLCIERIENQFSVVFDPASKKYDRSDAEYCFVIEHISQDEHIRRYGAEAYGSQPFTQRDGALEGWFGVGASGELVQIAEYWVKKFKKRRLVLLTEDEWPVWKDELTDEQYQTFKVNGQIVSERWEQHATVCQYMINGAEILEETDWIGSSIPIVPVWGREAVVEGRRRTFSLIRNAKDPQRMVNLYVSNIAEFISQMPKTPYMVPVGGIAANHENDWKTANNTPLAYLLYKAWDDSGRQLPPPSRVMQEPPIQALSIGLTQAIDGIKAAMGIYDASIGARSNETSGIAIERRKNAAEVVNFHFPDNESRSRKRIGEILVECIPLVDEAGSNVTVRSEEGKTTVVPVGVPYQDPKTGREVTHTLTDGDYGVHVSTGPTADSARHEQRMVMAELFKTVPALVEVLGDRFIAAMEFVGSEEDAERMKRWIMAQHPGLIKEDDQAAPIPPAVQAQMAQMRQDLEAAHGFAQEQFEANKTKQVQYEAEARMKQMDIDAQFKLKAADLEFQREKLKTDTDAKLVVAGLQTDVIELKAKVDQLNKERAIQSQERLASDEREHASSEADKTREHEAEVAASAPKEKE